jgi:hypothetical protein
MSNPEWLSHHVGGCRVVDFFIPPAGSLAPLELPSDWRWDAMAIRCEDRHRGHLAVAVNNAIAEQRHRILPAGTTGLVRPGWPEQWPKRLRLDEDVRSLKEINEGAT